MMMSRSKPQHTPAMTPTCTPSVELLLLLLGDGGGVELKADAVVDQVADVNDVKWGVKLWKVLWRYSSLKLVY